MLRARMSAVVVLLVCLSSPLLPSASSEQAGQSCYCPQVMCTSQADPENRRAIPDCSVACEPGEKAVCKCTSPDCERGRDPEYVKPNDCRCKKWY